MLLSLLKPTPRYIREMSSSTSTHVRSTNARSTPKALRPLFLCVSLVSIFLLTLLSGCSSNTVIITDLSEKDANEIVVYLMSKGIVAQKVAAPAAGAGAAQTAQLWNISVVAAKATEATGYLNRQGLPRKPGESLLTLFEPSGLVPSEQGEQIRYQAGLAAELAGVVRKFDGVIDADVQLSFPVGTSTEQSSAAVYVKYQRGGVLDDPNSGLANKLKFLISKSVPGLQFHNVMVIPDRAALMDVSLSPYADLLPEEEKEYTIIWGIILSKESISAFRTLFFCFCLGTFILLAVIVWLTWKIFPILPKIGGLRCLFTLKPFSIAEKEASPTAALSRAPAPAANTKKEKEEEEFDLEGAEEEGLEEELEEELGEELEEEGENK